jgi:hypothetical protein
MLPPPKIAEVRRLLAEGHSRRQVARMTGISRGTINHIADGRRFDKKARRDSALASLIPQQPPVRCGTCGGLVYPPCRLCGVQSQTNE